MAGAEPQVAHAVDREDPFESQQASRLVVSNLFRAECHGTAARFFANVHVFVGALAAGLAAVSGGSAFTGNTTLAGILGLLSAGFAGLLTALRPDERSQLHWKAAGEYFRQADDVYMTFRGDGDSSDAEASSTEPPPPPRQLAPSVAEPARAASAVDGGEPTAASQLRASQDAFHRLEAVGPPVPRRLERKTKQWIRDNQEWFPPQYDKFVEWWDEKQTGGSVGPIRRFGRRIRNLW